MNKNKFPIGSYAYPCDNSQLRLCNGDHANVYLAGTSWEDPKLVQVVSDPYNCEYEFIGNKYTHEFVTVLYERKYYRVMNYLRSEKPKSQVSILDSFSPYYWGL